jgi:hypothetical protein
MNDVMNEVAFTKITSVKKHIVTFFGKTCFTFGDGNVCGIGFLRQDQFATVVVELPHERRVTGKSSGCCQSGVSQTFT